MQNFRKSIGRALLLVASVGMVYFVGSRFYFRIDLTEDGRHSLHVATKALLQELEGEVRATIYLTGDLPTALKQLKRATQELLEEMNMYATHPLRYEFVDFAEVPAEEQKSLLQKLVAKGISPTHLYMQTQGQRIEKRVFPGALLAYQDREVGVLLLKGNKMTGPAQMVNQSIEGLEYELATALEKLVRTTRPKVALLRGHGEPDCARLQGLIGALEERYVLHMVNFSAASSLADYDALLITQPQKRLSEAEKYLLDQYLMQGGKLLLFLDRMRIDMEHLRQQKAFALPLDLGLEDQLFRYGIRINPDLVQDMQCGAYPIVVGRLGNQPQVQLLPWPFFPLLNRFAMHVATKNMDVLATQFVSSIDAIQTPGIQHTPLIFTSKYARRIGTPVYVDLESLRKPPQPAQYNHPYLPLAYLLEGKFTSLYNNRFLPDGVDIAHFLPESVPTQLLVVASGSFVLNSVVPQKKRPLPWGYDPFLQRQFANSDFVLNMLAYMLNEGGLINLKNKSLKIRLLDQVKVTQQRLQYQLLNLFLPLVLLGLLGLVWHYWTSRRYQL